jgi:hypothetical protein
VAGGKDPFLERKKALVGACAPVFFNGQIRVTFSPLHFWLANGRVFFLVNALLLFSSKHLPAHLGCNRSQF